MGRIEDEEHFLDECECWKQERMELWGKLLDIDRREVRKVKENTSRKLRIG